MLFRKPDLDTLVSALVAGVTSETPKRVVLMATEKELADPEILCLEVGGSGQTELNNFDHHDPEKELPPACKQAWEKFRPFWTERIPKEKLEILDRLISYTWLVDEGKLLSQPFPSLSHLISGICLVEKNPLLQFSRGLKVLHTLLEEEIDPFSRIENSRILQSEEIQTCLKAKEANYRLLQEALARASFFRTEGGLLVGVLVTEAIGGAGSLFFRGADLAVLHHPGIGKFTICSRQISLTPLLERLKTLEEGWGGRRTIIGSPACGSSLPLELILDIIKEIY